MGIFPSQGHTAFHLRLRENDTPNSWASSLHRGTQRSISVSERNDTPISWAHPTHGLSHRPTHSVCVLEDVSRSCNHQHVNTRFILTNLSVNLQYVFMDIIQGELIVTEFTIRHQQFMSILWDGLVSSVH
jgi:hypothetical protein